MPPGLTLRDDAINLVVGVDQHLVEPSGSRNTACLDDPNVEDRSNSRFLTKERRERRKLLEIRRYILK